MKRSVFILFTLLSATAFSQSMIEKCKPEFDEEVMMQVYTDLTEYPEIKDENFTLFDFMDKNFKIPKKDYGTVRIKFIWMVEKDGKCTFLKLASPAGDKDMENEARRVVAMLPLYSPAKCGTTPVPCKVDYEFTIGAKK